jgi:hypothetical protein
MDDKQAFRERMESELRQWESQVNKMASRIEYSRVDTDAWREGTDALYEWRVRLVDARRYLHELDTQSGAQWDNLREGMERTWRELERGLERLKARAS